MRKEINNHPGYYIYEDGRLWSNVTKKFLKHHTNNRGYLLARNGKPNGLKGPITVHKLVALHFLPEPNFDRAQVDHIDGNKLNNHFLNLQWVTGKENVQRSWRVKSRKAHRRNGVGSKPGVGKVSKLTDNQVLVIKQKYKDGHTQKQIAEIFGISQMYVSHIVRGKRRQYINDKIY